MKINQTQNEHNLNNKLIKFILREAQIELCKTFNEMQQWIFEIAFNKNQLQSNKNQIQDKYVKSSDRKNRAKSNLRLRAFRQRMLTIFNSKRNRTVLYLSRTIKSLQLQNVQVQCR